MRGVVSVLACVLFTGLLASPALAQNNDLVARGFAERVIGPAEGQTGVLRLVVDRLHNRPRLLRQGDVYADGWVVRSLTTDAATLAKAGQILVIAIRPGVIGTFDAMVRAPTPDVAADIEAGDPAAAAADSGTVAQQWQAARIASKASSDTNALREFDNLDAQGPDRVVMGTVYPGRIGAAAMGPPDFISTTGYYLGKDAEGHFVFFRTLDLFKAAGNAAPIE